VQQSRCRRNEPPNGQTSTISASANGFEIIFWMVSQTAIPHRSSERRDELEKGNLMKSRKVASRRATRITHTPAHLGREHVAVLLREGLVENDTENQRALWFGQILTFTDGQSLCWQVLWQNFLRGNLPLPQGRVISAWHGESSQVSDLFKRSPAWKTVIVGDGRGYLWLHVPQKYFSEQSAVPPPTNSGQAAVVPAGCSVNA
jgi:hypothetical protein